MLSSFKSRLEDILVPLFEGSMPAILSDSPEVVAWIKTTIGCQAFLFHANSNYIPENCRENIVLIAMENAQLPEHAIWQKTFEHSRFLSIPLLAFEASMNAVRYTFEILTRSSFSRSAALNDYWMQVLLKKEEKPMLFRGNGSDFECRFENAEITVMAPRTTPYLAPGEWDSMGACFEVGMVPDADVLRPPFTINGHIQPEGIAIAHHRWMPEHIVPFTDQAWRLLQDVRARGLFPLDVTIQDSQLTEIRAGREDLTSQLMMLTNKRRQLILTEMAFSTNEALDPAHIDWTINSQLNEGASGIHIGIGDGLTGAHIDLICPGVTWQK